MRTTASIEISRPAADVFDFISDFERNPDWQGGMRECTWTSEKPLAIGSTYDQLASFMGRSIESSFVVTDLAPGSSITIETTKSTFPIKVTRTVEHLADERCRAVAVVEGGPGGIMRLFSPLTRLMVQRSVRGDYRRLKQLLESDGGR